jgi:hypothetical protein
MVKYTTDSFIEKAKLLHGNKYIYNDVEYVNMKTKVKIICPIHGEFLQSPEKHLYDKCGCPNCAGNQRLSSNGFIQKAMLVHGGMYDYSFVKYKNNRTNVKIKCYVHGIFEQTPSNHLRGKGCPYCANNVLLTTDEFIAKAKLIHGNKYDYSMVDYSGNRFPVNIICRKHGVFSQVPYVHLAGSGCPVCGRESQQEHRNTKEIYKKFCDTMLSRYGVVNPMDDVRIQEKQKLSVGSDEVNRKRIDTKRKNNSFNVSSIEDKLGEYLISLFGEDDIVPQYSSNKYPFQCDYYIKSRDLYIELNAHWSHGGHWYDDVKDRALVEEWKCKTKFYVNSAKTFSVRDVQKRKYAKMNNLNYVVFWKNDLSDVKLWIEKGCPDGQDWLKEYSWK